MKPNETFAVTGKAGKNHGREGVLAAAVLLLAALGAVDSRASSERGLLEAMARFDGAYIPALALSNQGKREQTGKAMARLRDEWERFEGGYGSYGGDGGWKEALRRVGDSLDEAAMYLDDGELPKMHEVLEEVRDEFLRLREERSLDYYVDKLNRYHETMEEVLSEAGEAGSEGLDDTRKGRIRALEGEARRRWEALSAAPFDASLFGFDAEKTKELEQAVSAVGKSLDALRGALEGGSGEAVIKSVQGLRPPYVKAFLMFGDFGGLE